MILYSLRLGWVMIEYVLQIIIIAIIILCGLLDYFRYAELKLLMSNEGSLMKDNMNHIANAIVGLSEILDEADEVVNMVSQVPTMGDMMQQMIQGFILSKLQPQISPNMQRVAEQLITPEEVPELHGSKTLEDESTEEKKKQSD